jgi:hypothetical protein
MRHLGVLTKTRWLRVMVFTETNKVLIFSNKLWRHLMSWMKMKISVKILTMITKKVQITKNPTFQILKNIYLHKRTNIYKAMALH